MYARNNLVDTLVFLPMTKESLNEVIIIENSVHAYPWTRQAFESSIDYGYVCRIARDPDGLLVGYFILMLAVDEVHLLNIAVLGRLQNMGFGRGLLDKVMEMSKEMGAQSVLLEVRPSNLRALRLYELNGFNRIGVRKDYYQSFSNTREDAIVMRRML